MALYSIGDSAEGGKIAYILQSGDVGYDPLYQKGIVVSTSEQSVSSTWDTGSSSIVGTSQLLLSGLVNSNSIVASVGSGSYAAKYCRDYIGGGFSDWCLPSRNDVVKLYESRVLTGGWVATVYHTSSETDNGGCYEHNFNGGFSFNGIKSDYAHVRAVRYFSNLLPEPAKIDSITGSATIIEGGSSQYVASGSVLAGGTGVWSTSNSNITIDQNGLASAITRGLCDIIYTITGGYGVTVSASISVTVNKPIDPFKKSYIQIGSNPAIDIYDRYKIRIKSIPLQISSEVKDVQKRDWFDQHGDDEYISPNVFYKAYEVDVKFVYNGNLDTARDAIYPFIQSMQGSEFCLFDDWKISGIRCRYMSYSNDSFYRRDRDLVEFSLKLKVNNPLCYGIRIENNSFSGKADCDMDIYWGDGSKMSYLSGVNISKTSEDLAYAIVVPSKMSNVSFSTYSYPPIQFGDTGYYTLLSSTGAKYIKI